MRFGQPLRAWDGLVALVLATATIVSLGLTSVMGYTRDESFYFKYATVYQNWFHRVAHRDEAPASPDDLGGGPLGKRDVLGTWRENFEHPSLMKTLFGFSWRAFGLKRRPLSFGPASKGRIEVTRLEASDGFEVGDDVRLLGPVPNEYPWPVGALGTPLGPPEPALLADARVVERSDSSATLELTDASALASIAGSCKAPASPSNAAPEWLTGCQAETTGTLQFLNEAQAMRLPTWVFFGLLVALLYLFGTELFGRRAGLFAALAFLVTPHQFFHGHLCTFDMPVTTMIIATVYAFWKSIHSPFWVFGAAVLWGLSLVTKLNGYFIPVPLVAAWLTPWLVDGAVAMRASFAAQWAAGRFGALWAWLRERRRALLLGGAALVVAGVATMTLGRAAGLAAGLFSLSVFRFRLALPPLPRAFLWMLMIGLPMQFWLWPSMWFDTAQSFSSYVSFHGSHVNYPQEYFGDLLNVPPFPLGYPFVMTWLTVPVPIQVVMLVGLLTLFITERRTVPLFERALLFANALLPIGIISIPSTPIFGGVKHWMATLAFGALIGGFGFEWICRRVLALIARPAWRHALVAAALSLTLASGAVASVRYVACGTGYYNELIGGLQGAADARMMRKFWGFAAAYALDYVNVTAPRGASVAFHEATWDAFDWYQRVGLLRRDLRWRRDPTEHCRPGDLYLFHHQGPMAQDEIDGPKALETIAPVHTWSLDGVPMLSVYECRKP